jgi:hypothetical protein
MPFLFKETAKKREPQAGRDLDEQIARLVEGDSAAGVPAYSTDDRIAAALAERFSAEWGWWHYEKREVYGGWSIGWIEEKQPLLRSVRPIQSSAPTRALAICRSILKVSESIRDRREGRIATFLPLDSNSATAGGVEFQRKHLTEPTKGPREDHKVK